MIGFIETQPNVEPHNGLFRLTLDGQVFVLTRHAFTALRAKCRIAEAKAIVAGMDDAEKLVAFPKPTRRRNRP